MTFKEEMNEHLAEINRLAAVMVDQGYIALGEEIGMHVEQLNAMVAEIEEGDG